MLRRHALELSSCLLIADSRTYSSEQCINANPAWAKGYARKGAALHGLRRWDDAIAAYEAGLKIEDSAALRNGLQEVQEAREFSSGNPGDAMGLGKISRCSVIFWCLLSLRQISHVHPSKSGAICKGVPSASDI